MALSFEDFRSSLLHADSRQGRGLQLSDAEAQQVHADPQASRAWYDYWLAVSGQAELPAGAGNDPFDVTASAAQAAPTVEIPPLGGHDFAQAGALPSAPPASSAQPAAFAPGPSPEQPRKKSRVGLWVTLSIIGALLLIAIIVVVIAFTTARHWTKVDVPEKPETFHSEEYETGQYLVADDGVSPCVVDQDWTDCITAMEAQYTSACVGIDLAPSAVALCAQHREEIDRMRAEDSEGSIVASLGGFGHLTRTPQTATREVSNEDHEAAVTHEAVCYLGFLGECE